MTFSAAVSTLNDLIPTSRKWETVVGLALLTLAGLAVQGYHPYAEDAEIYLPGAEKLLHPALFPVGAEFFESHASLTLFPRLIAVSVRLSHLPLNYVLFAWQLTSISLLLLATWELAGLCFVSRRAQWGAACLMAALLTLPVAGTALYVLDQYFNPRNVAAFAVLFAVARTIESKYVRALLWLVTAALFHPLMAVFAFTFCGFLAVLQKRESKLPEFALLLPLSGFFAPPTSAYHEAARFHGFHYITNWQWYEWLGILAPVLIFWWMARLAESKRLPHLRSLCCALIVYDICYFAAALIVDVPKSLEAFARVQPLRSLHLLYMLLIIFGGGFLAEFVLKDRIWRWLALFLPLCAGMFIGQRQLFPSSPHVEWPWAQNKNSWAQSFLWIRDNTPADALFAIHPMYIKIPGEDTIGFRALAERSRLADAYKDSGAVSMFPPLAEEWWREYQSQKNWAQFNPEDLLRLNKEYGVTWVVLRSPDARDLACPYKNAEVLVCKLSRDSPASQAR